MNLTLDQAAIDAAIQTSANKAIADAIGSYSTTSALGGIVSEEIAHGAVAQALRQAVRSVDTAELTAALSREMQRAVTAAVVSLVEEGLVDLVARIRGIGQYGAEDARKRAELRATLLGKPTRASEEQAR